MKILTWAIRLIVFLLLFLFAVVNTEPVTLHFFLDQVWQAPLVIVLLITFAAGAIFGLLSLLGLVYTQKREIARLRKQLPRSPGTGETR